MNKKYIVITRPILQVNNFIRQLRQLDFDVFPFATIKLKKTTLSIRQKEILLHISRFDWVIFTSQNGIKFFIDLLLSLKVNPSILSKTRIAAVGPKTKKAIEGYKLHVAFVPSKFTTKDLGQELPDVDGKTILLLRASIASDELITNLKKRRGVVTTIPIYDTIYPVLPNKKLTDLLHKKAIGCITFTSSSTVTGFLKQIDSEVFKKFFSLPVISIGPVTTRTLKKVGFTNIHTARFSTTEGMVEKIREIFGSK